VFSDVGLGGFAERAYRELLATGHTVRRRTDDARLDLTAQEAQIAHLAAGGLPQDARRDLAARNVSTAPSAEDPRG
jgi:hypothetical protein